MTQGAAPTLHGAARWYAKRELHVFALRPRDKVPATEHGCKDATIDPATINAMWLAEPDRNVGIATGRPSKLVVLDIDGEEGEASLTKLARLHGDLPTTPEARTGKGRHLYFRHPGQPVRNSARKLGPGLDVRADGGYVVAPPSIHPNGSRYEWAPARRPDQTELAELPAWLRDELVEREQPRIQYAPTVRRDQVSDVYARSALERECTSVANAANGGRNHQLNESSFSIGQLVAGGSLDEQHARSALLSAAEGCGLPRREAQMTVNSGLTAGMKSPRTAPDRSSTTGYARTPSSVSGRPSRSEPEQPAPEGGDAWPEPIPFGGTQELPVFPVDALPSWLRVWVAAEAHATQTPVDMAAVLALAVIATCCARRLRVQVREGWYEPANIYVCVSAPPAVRKSAVFRDATVPLSDYEREQAERLRPDIEQSHDTLTRAQKRHARAIENAAKVNDAAERLTADQDVREAREALTASERGLVFAPRFTCGDVTQEALARLLQQQDECIALMDAEGCGPIALMLGRYSDGAASVDIFLRGHAGDQYRADRVGRDPIVLRSPAITLAITVQPEVLRQLGTRREMRGLGLLARFLWCMPVSMVGRRSSEPQPVPGVVQTAYANQLRTLLDLPARDDGEPHSVRLSSAAWIELRGLMDRIEPHLGPGGELEHMADWAGKLAGAVARIAGLLHAATHPEGPWDVEVSADTMRQASVIGDYLLAHARAALGSMGTDPVVADAEHVLAWLRAHETQQISRRDLHRAMQTRFARVADLDPVLAVLAERGYVRMQDVAAGGAAKRSVAHVYVNPAAHDRRDNRDGRTADLADTRASVTSVTSVSGTSARAELDL